MTKALSLLLAAAVALAAAPAAAKTSKHAKHHKKTHAVHVADPAHRARELGHARRIQASGVDQDRDVVAKDLPGRVADEHDQEQGGGGVRPGDPSPDCQK